MEVEQMIGLVRGRLPRGTNGPMARSLHGKASWTSLVRAAMTAARVSLMRRPAPRWVDMRSTGKPRGGRAASTAAMRWYRGNTPPPSVGSRAMLSCQRPRRRLPLLRLPARGRQSLGKRRHLRLYNGYTIYMYVPIYKIYKKMQNI